MNLVDRSQVCLQGEDVRTLLEACGALRHLRPVAANSMSGEELRELRKKAGHVETSGQKDRIDDWMLAGLERILALLPSLTIEHRTDRARLLWEELAHLEERRGKGVFSGEYSWTHYGKYNAQFDAAFVRLLNQKAWVPDREGDLQQPKLVLFDSLSWKASPFLQSKIQFKPPFIDQLAAEAGIEPGVLDLLRKLGVTTESELRARLHLKEAETKTADGSGKSSDEKKDEEQARGSAQAGPTGQTNPSAPPLQTGVGGGTPDPSGTHGAGGNRSGLGAGNGPRSGQGVADEQADRTGTSPSGAPPFVSYVGTDHKQANGDDDGAAADHRGKVEEAQSISCWTRKRGWSQCRMAIQQIR